MDSTYHKGRGAQINTPNPFRNKEYVQEHIEGLDEEMISNPQTKLFHEDPKNIISEYDSPDLGHGFSINPYQGCEHGCIYCYARNAHHYWGFSAGLDFETKIVVKPKAAQMLEAKMLTKNWEPKVIQLSGNTDCYQPTERKLKITRSLLEVLSKYRNPVGIITKNSLITRDIDILQDMAKDNLVNVMISITSEDESLRRKMEPRTASAAKRFETIAKLSEAGVPTGMMAAPIIPGLNDHEIPSLVRQAADHGALSAAYTVVRLNGAIGELFEDWLKKNYPDRFNKVWNLIRSLHDGKVNDSEWGRRMKGEGEVATAIAQLFRAAKKKYLSNREFPQYDFTKFRKGGNLTLF